MRIEAAPHLSRFDDRRPRPELRRAGFDRRAEPAPVASPRAAASPHVWLQPAFGAHILGQAAPERAAPGVLARAYAQPESRTPLRPRAIRTA
jgi:hypothetical protein